MSDIPIRTLVINQLVYNIGQIPIITGAQRGIVNPFDVDTNEFLFAFCFDGDDYAKRVENKIVHKTFVLNIETWCHTDDLDAQFDIVEAEIHKKLLGTVDLQRQYTLKIVEREVENARFHAGEDERLGAITTPYEITYHHAFGDPYSLNITR